MPIIIFREKNPKIHPSAYISPRAVLIGDVEIGEGSSVWDNAVIRGDMNSIKIGRFTSIQDNCTIHVGLDNPVHVGDYVTVGHNAVIHGCRIGDYVLIGIGSTILSGADIEGPSIIGAGAVVKENDKVPSQSLSVGVPASVIRRLRKKDVEKMKQRLADYFSLVKQYKNTEQSNLSK